MPRLRTNSAALRDRRCSLWKLTAPVLCEIPEKDFHCELSPHGAMFGFSEGAMLALQKAALAKVLFVEKKKASEGVGSEVVFLTPDDLKKTAQGRANVQRYLCAMR